MTDQQVPFAPHAIGWHYSGKSKNVAYAVLDGRTIQRDMTDLDKILCASAADFLGKPMKQVELIDAKWASDYFCGSVLIVYYACIVE